MATPSNAADGEAKKKAQLARFARLIQLALAGD